MGYDKKWYLCYWGDGYVFPGVRIVDEDFFSVENGYSEKAVNDILSLDWGECWRDMVSQEQHYVLRIQEPSFRVDVGIVVRS